MEPSGEEREVREETRILVIEDDPDMRFILQKGLEKIRYRAQAVESNLEGLEVKKWSNCDHGMAGCAKREIKI